MSKSCIILFVLAVFLASVPAKADSLRCGGSADIVQTGDSKGAVIDALGEPDREAQGSTVEVENKRVRKNSVTVTGQLIYLYYTCDGLEYKLTFSDDTLINITSTGRRK